MFAFVVGHLLVALLLPAVARRSTRAAFLCATLPPAAALIWVLAQTGPVLRGQARTETIAWAPGIALSLGFRLDALALLMTILVAGIGVLVLIYSVAYFSRGGGDARRCAPLLLAFAGVMLGLTFADDLITVYVFWELTTICSFLLVGQSGISRESRRSALQALMITAVGGLVMLLGFVVLGEAAGTYRISALAAGPPTGTAVTVAAMLILFGAFAKSAQLPLHNWLPAAMVAPTPVSAYLHAASMVKAGVFLVARLGPVFTGEPAWHAVAMAFGLVTMLFGGWCALHEYDLKLLLAYGTVSQLGFLMVLFGAGTYNAVLAGDTMLLAHGLFKAALFLIVGIIDHQAGSRDIRELSGVGRKVPLLAATAALAAASMAGLPPMLGFLGKEAALHTFLTRAPADLVIDAALVLGAMLTVCYSLRLLLGAFATKPGLAPTVLTPPGKTATVPTALPVLASVVLGVGYPVADELARAYAGQFGTAGQDYHLGLWHGWTGPLLLSAIAIAGGIVLYLVGHRLSAMRRKLPKTLSAQRGYELAMVLLERSAVAVTGRLQVGSLPTYIGIILLTVLVIPGTALLVGTRFPVERVHAVDNLLQIPLSLTVVVAVLATTRAKRRLTAVLLVGVVGYAIGGLFIVDGAPDLALAQFLVETLTVVAFVFVLRRLPERFTETDTGRLPRAPKLVIAIATGVFLAIAAIVFSAARQTTSQVSEQFMANARYGAGATNVVNAIIVDFRALDTVGEIAVLAVAATGVASLIMTARFERRRRSRGARPSETGHEVRE